MGDKSQELLEIKINCRTWLKDTEDLFDFETSNLNESIFTQANLDKDYYIIKYKDESDEKQKEKNKFYLQQFNKAKNKFKQYNQNSRSSKI